MDRLLPRILGFTGGYVTDLPEQSREPAYWLKAENVIYEVSGAARKVGGAAKINSTAISGAPNVTGMYDFWRGGGAATFTQKFVVMTSDSKIWKEDMDGVFDEITGSASISANAIPHFSIAGDLLIIATDKNDTPLYWDQTGDVQTLGGSPPAARGFTYHVNRGWAWGSNANASRLYYSASDNVQDWSGADTGAIDIEAEDGDRIINVVPHKGALIIFKGPNKGSIHILSGTSPSGSDAFARKVFVRGIPAVSIHSAVPVGDDLLFVSNRGIHSLSATASYGDFTESDVTRYLKRFFREIINRSNLSSCQGVNYASKSCCLWTFTGAGSTENNLVLGLSYVRVEEEGWKAFTWNRDCFSAAIRKHPSTVLDEVVFGGTDGFVRRQDTNSRNIDDDTSYSFRMQSPHLLLGQSYDGRVRGDQPFAINRMYLRSVASGDHDVSVTITRDNQTPETYAFNQGSSGFELDVSQLDIDTLGGESTRIIYADPAPVGVARSVQLDIIQSGLNQDANLLEVGMELEPIAQTDAVEVI